jgi:hypothetical protein
MGFFSHLFNLDEFDAHLSKKPATINSQSGLQLDEKTVELVLAEIDVDAAICAHEDWEQQFQDAVNGN